MQIGYKDLLEIYVNRTTPDQKTGDLMIDSPYLCYVISDEFGSDLNFQSVIRNIGIDVYGVFWGRVKYYISYILGNRCVLEYIYPNLEIDLGIQNKRDFGSRFNKLRDRRIAILTKLAEKYPNRKFNVEFFF